MIFDSFLGNYTNIINSLGTLGTVVAACIAVWVVYKNSKDLNRIRLSGFSIEQIDNMGVVYLKNNTEIDLEIAIYKNNEDIISEHIKDVNYKKNAHQ